MIGWCLKRQPSCWPQHKSYGLVNSLNVDTLESPLPLIVFKGSVNSSISRWLGEGSCLWQCRSVFHLHKSRQRNSLCAVLSCKNLFSVVFQGQYTNKWPFFLIMVFSLLSQCNIFSFTRYSRGQISRGKGLAALLPDYPQTLCTKVSSWPWQCFNSVGLWGLFLL